MPLQSKEKYKQTIDISLYFDEWSRCLGSRHQRDNLYRLGKFDGCTLQWEDLKTVIRAKTEKDQKEVEQMMANTHYVKHLGSDPKASPTAGVIWELKEKPGWD
jgi:Protein of unknown function (DUF3128)